MAGWRRVIHALPAIERSAAKSRSLPGFPWVGRLADEGIFIGLRYNPRRKIDRPISLKSAIRDFFAFGKQLWNVSTMSGNGAPYRRPISFCNKCVGLANRVETTYRILPARRFLANPISAITVLDRHSFRAGADANWTRACRGLGCASRWCSSMSPAPGQAWRVFISAMTGRMRSALRWRPGLIIIQRL